MIRSRSQRVAACVLSLVVALLVFAGDARAVTGVCDSTGATSAAACINAIQASGAGKVVNDIFRDAAGKDAFNLPVYGRLLEIEKIFPACLAPTGQTANCAGCNPGTSTPPYDCPGAYTCAGGTPTYASVSLAVNGKPDRVWGHPCRISDHTLTAGCPNYASCVGDGVAGGYNPWEGFVFDLGGPSNQVAIFADNDHGPQPCECGEFETQRF